MAACAQAGTAASQAEDTSLTGDGSVSTRECQGRWLGDACVSLLLTARYLQWYLTQARHQEWQEDGGEG